MDQSLSKLSSASFVFCHLHAFILSSATHYFTSAPVFVVCSTCLGTDAISRSSRHSKLQWNNVCFKNVAGNCLTYFSSESHDNLPFYLIMLLWVQLDLYQVENEIEN